VVLCFTKPKRRSGWLMIIQMMNVRHVTIVSTSAVVALVNRRCPSYLMFCIADSHTQRHRAAGQCSTISAVMLTGMRPLVAAYIAFEHHVISPLRVSVQYPQPSACLAAPSRNDSPRVGPRSLETTATKREMLRRRSKTNIDCCFDAWSLGGACVAR